MEKRLGKCLVAVRWALTRPRRDRILVSAPFSSVPGWQDELDAEGEPYALLTGTRQQRLDALLAADAAGTRFYVVNPAGLVERGGPSTLAKFPWDTVIIDESTVMRNPQAQITKVLQQVGRRVRQKAILSGDYMPGGSPLEAFEQLRFLYGGFMGHSNWWSFRDEHFQPAPWNAFEWLPKPGALGVIRRAIHEEAFVLKRKDAGMKEVRVTEKHAVALPPKVRKAYDFAEKNWELPGDVMTKYAPVVHHWLRQVAGGYPEDPALHSPHKTKAVVELVKDEHKDDQIVVSFAYNRELEAVVSALRKARVSVDVLRGGMKLEDRRAVQHRFKAGRSRVVCGGVKALRYGIDLSASSTMFRFSGTYDPEDHSQAGDRIVSFDKPDPLLYVNLMAVNTLDQDIVDAMGDKRAGANLFMSQIRANFLRRTGRELVD